MKLIWTFVIGWDVWLMWVTSGLGVQRTLAPDVSNPKQPLKLVFWVVTYHFESFEFPIEAQVISSENFFKTKVNHPF